MLNGDAAYDKVLINVPLARAGLDARRDAIKAAMDEGLRLWLETQMNDLNEATANRFAAALDAYVVSTEVVDERVVTLGRELAVAVYIDRERLRFDLASYLFPRRKNPPGAVVIIGEEFVGGAGYNVGQNEISTSMLTKSFREQGFRVTSNAEITNIFSDDDLMHCLREGNVAAGKLGRALQVEVVILGEARTVRVDDTNQGTLKVRALVDVMAVRARDGRLLDRIEAEAVVSGNDLQAMSRRATEDAIYKVQQKLLVAAALGTLNSDTSKLTRLVVRSENIKRAAPPITTFLDDAESITSVELLHSARNELVYDIAYEGGLGELVRHLENSTERAFWFVSVQVVADEMIFDLAVRD
ncbi:MAG: hypothetical protein VCD00_07540 [Candidatus Hydrogenedentota bacterium]